MFVSGVRIERELGAPFISLNTLTGHRSATWKVRRSYHQTVAGAAPASGVMPMDSSLHPLEIRIQAIKLSPCHAGPLTHHPQRLGMTASFLTCSGPHHHFGSR